MEHSVCKTSYSSNSQVYYWHHLTWNNSGKESQLHKSGKPVSKSSCHGLLAFGRPPAWKVKHCRHLQ